MNNEKKPDERGPLPKKPRPPRKFPPTVSARRAAELRKRVAEARAGQTGR